MQDFNHPHVLKLLGVTMGSGGLPRIIVPFMANGDLLNFLRRRNPMITAGAEVMMVFLFLRETA